MGKDIDIIKVITHADGGEAYSEHATNYTSNVDSVAVKGYGVDETDTKNAQMQFDTTARYYGNEGKNEYIQLMMAFLKDTADDAETAMAITDQVIDPLKANHLILIGEHKKQTVKSDYHTHTFIETTDLETGKMLHPNNKFNYSMAQRMADTIQKPVKLVIEKKNKSPEPDSSQNGGNNTKKKKDFTRRFYPHKNTND